MLEGRGRDRGIRLSLRLTDHHRNVSLDRYGDTADLLQPDAIDTISYEIGSVTCMRTILPAMRSDC